MTALSSILFGLMGVVRAFTQIKNADIKTSIISIATKKLERQADEGNLKAIEKLGLAKTVEAGASGAAATGSAVNTAAKIGEKVATDGATTSTIAFGTALYTVLWPIGLIIAAIGTLIAIIYGISKAVENAKKIVWLAS